jgi:L-arabinose isomerase
MTAIAPAPVTVALLGIGLDTYWPQFKGLKDRLIGYQARINARLAKLGAVVADGGLVDSPEAARATAESLQAQKPELLFLYVSTYALSSTVLPVVQRLGVPTVVLNLQPVARLDYAAFNKLGDRGAMTGEWLAHCQACSVPEIACVFDRAAIPFRQVTGWLDDDHAWNAIGEWLSAARVRQVLRNTRVGLLGHYYGGMLDVYSDPTQLSAAFGCHFEHLEPGELLELTRAATPESIAAKTQDFQSAFAISQDCASGEITRAARTASGLDALVHRHRLGAMAYYFEGRAGDAEEDLVTSVIPGNTLLTARDVPVAGEYEVKNVLAMKIMSALGGGGSFSEFYLMDFVDDVVLLGHDGPAHPSIAEGRVGLVPVPVYHGKPGKGLSIQMAVRHGPVTLLSVVQHRAGLELLVAQGESVAGPTLAIGNTNSRYRFAGGVRAFIDGWCAGGPAHHCAIGAGHHASAIARFADLIGIPCRRVA